jgi:hypothetical protein
MPARTGNERLTRGTAIKWAETTGWLDLAGVKPPTGPYLLWGVEEGLRHWHNRQIVEEKITKPLPDLDQLNAAVPTNTWENGPDGKPRPPWSLQHIVYLLDPTGGKFYTHMNSTVGARMMNEELEERWMVMIELRGADVVAVVELSHRAFKTKKWGTKLRPDLHVLEWRRHGGGERLVAPVTPQIAGPATPEPVPTTPPAASSSTPAAQPAPKPGYEILDRIKPVTASEELKDQVLW